MDRTTQRLMMGRQQSAVGQVEWTTPGIYNWTVPYNVYSISPLVIGATGGGGLSETWGRSGAAAGGLRWAAYIPVIPGEVLEIEVGAGGTAATTSISSAGNGGISAIRRAGVNLLFANGGQGSPTYNGSFIALGGDGTAFSDNVGGGDGGDGGHASTTTVSGAGGGGAAGYGGKGGRGADDYLGTAATAGTGGGGGGGGGGGVESNASTYSYGGGGQGGGVGLYGQGVSGAAGANGSQGTPGTGGIPSTPATGGKAGSNGTDGSGSSSNGGGGNAAGLYGGAPGGSEMGAPGRAGRSGAVRIIHGEGRSYPSTRTANE